MRPLEIAAEEYGDAFGGILGYCMERGFLYSDEKCFVCGWYTDSSFILEKEVKKNIDKGDTIFVFICIGSMKDAFMHVEKRKFISFEHFDEKYKLYDYDRFRRLVWAVA